MKHSKPCSILQNSVTVAETNFTFQNEKGGHNDGECENDKIEEVEKDQEIDFSVEKINDLREEDKDFERKEVGDASIKLASVRKVKNHENLKKMNNSDGPFAETSSSIRIYRWNYQNFSEFFLFSVFFSDIFSC